MDAATLADLTGRPFTEVAPSLLYPSYTRGAPELLVIRFPAALEAEFGAHRVVFRESGMERRLMDDMMALPLRLHESGRIDLRQTVDRVMARPSTAPKTKDILVLHYIPAAEGWPHVVVVKMPLRTPGQGLGRERYAYEAFPDKRAADDHLVKLGRLYAGPARNMGIKMEVQFPYPVM